MQKLTVLGNLGQDPQERVTANGNKVTTFSLAVSPKKDQTLWYECQIWEYRLDMFKNIIPHLKKGSRVMIGADFHIPEIYQKKDGSPGLRLRIEPHFIHFVGLIAEKKENRSIFEEKEIEEELPF